MCTKPGKYLVNPWRREERAPPQKRCSFFFSASLGKQRDDPSKKKEEEEASPTHASLALALPGDMKWEGEKKTQRNFRTVAQAAQEREGERTLKVRSVRCRLKANISTGLPVDTRIGT